MRRLVMTLAVCLLACLGTIPVSAQEPSPLVPPPPWFGGERVELLEYGFALTVPDGWLAFDPTVDAVSQIEAAADHIDRDGWGLLGADALASTGSILGLRDARSWNECSVDYFAAALPLHDMAAQVDDIAARYAERLAGDPDLSVEPLQRLDLPAGPAYVIPSSTVPELVLGSDFLLAHQDSLFLVSCSHDTRTDDLWLSIVESIEFLPAEE